MSNKPAKFAGAISVAFVAGLALMTVTRAASAADECLTEPKGPTPSGKHWRYHIEHGTGRHCWYLRGEDDATAGSTAQDQSVDTSDDASSTKDQAVSAADQAPPSKPPAKKVETPATRSIADARAEWPARAPAEDSRVAAPAAPPAPPSAANASVFPDPQAALAAKPAADTSSTSSSDVDTQPDTTASITPAPAPAAAPVTQANPLGDRHLGSIPMLLLVAFGALGLAGLTGSTVYRLASLRRPVRREDRWSRNIDLPPPPTPARHRMPKAARPEPIQEHFEGEHFQSEPLVFESERRVREPVELEPFEPRAEVTRTDARTGDSNRRRDRTPVAVRPEPAREDFEQEDFESERLSFESERRARELAELEPRPDVSHTDARTDDTDQRKREQIEAYLAQLTRQLRADLEAGGGSGSRRASR
jgi:hypothetical protein